MDLKQEDILNVEIDSELLLSYELDKLSLENIQREIFELTEDEIIKNDKPDTENSNLITKNIKIVKSEDLSRNDCKNDIINTTLVNYDLCNSEIKDSNSEVKEENKDINGNEEISSLQNLNQSFVKLELSDSDNEEKECKILTERAPIRSRRQSSKNHRANRSRNTEPVEQIFEFNYDERLRFYSGLSHVEINDSYAVNNSTITNNYVFYDNLPVITSAEPPVFTFSNDVPYEDYRSNSVSSPESGYETSNSITGGSPPPHISVPVLNISASDLYVDEQSVIDDLVELEETTDYISSTFNPLSHDIDDKDRVENIRKFLKAPEVQTELSGKEYSNESINSVPVGNYDIDLNFDTQYLLPSSKVQQRTDIKGTEYGDEIVNLCKNLCSLPNDLSFQNSFYKAMEKVPVIDNVDLNHISSVEVSSSSSKAQQKADNHKKLKIKPPKNKARSELRNFLSDDELLAIGKRMYKKVIEDKINNKKIKIILVEDEMDKTSDNRTNLHLAILNSKMEEIYALVEIHKQYCDDFKDLNNRDKYGKTALDYAKQKNMPLVVEYLKENNAIQSINI